MTTGVADLEVRVGPGLLTAALDAAARAELHPRRVTLPHRGDELSVLHLEAQALQADSARLRVDVRYRAFIGWTEASFSGALNVTVRLRIFDGALRVQRPRLDATSEVLLQTWSVEAGMQGLPALVLDALERALSAPVPLASARFDLDADGVLRRYGGGRRKPAPPPPPVEADVCATASVAGVLRLMSTSGRATFKAGVAETPGVRVAVDGGRLRVDGADAPRALAALAAPIEAVRLTRRADPLHDEVVAVVLGPGPASLDDDGLRATCSARVVRSRAPLPVTLTGVATRGEDVLTLHLAPAEGGVVEMGVARARSALANQALRPATLAPGLTLDAGVEGRLRAFGLLA